MDELTRLALAAQDGDRTAFAGFVRMSQAQVWRLCRHLTSQDRAADCTQETYLRAYRSLPRYAARASALTWLLSIARRVCADQLRTQRRSVPRADLDPTAVEVPASQRGADIAEGVALRDLLSELDTERRTAFVCTQLLGLSYAETAQVSGVPIGTVRSRVARAREQLVRAVRGADEAGTG